MGLVSSQSSNHAGHCGLRPYDDKDKAELAKMYTPEQIRAIEEGEAAIDLADLERQGRFRVDPYRLPYLDDLSTIQPVVDKKVREVGTIPENARWLDPEEQIDEVATWINQQQEDYYRNTPLSPNQTPSNSDAVDEPKPSRLDFMKFMEESTFMTGGGKRGSGIVAPALPKIPSMKGQYQSQADSDPRDPDGKYDRLRKQTGLSLDEILNLKMKKLVSHFVTNQTRLGKIQSFYVLAVAGDGNGRLGIGEGKALESGDAITKAYQAAIRNMRPIPRYEGRTIYGEVEGKVAASVVQLKSKPPGTSISPFAITTCILTPTGFGLRCQHLIFEMARCAGIQDLAARVPRGRNKMNTVKATLEALLNQRIPDEIARGRGKKLVDVRKVYYGGNQRVPEQLEAA
jgi:small subunit ribosomal protein S5